MGTERFDTVVIGGSQAGLATGYHLRKQERSFVILEGAERIGHGWRRRWDSLRLFTPAKYNGLPGMDFPAKGWSFPTKDEMAEYLEAYAQRFDLPVRTGVWVDGLEHDGDRYVVSAGSARYEADNVVVATGAHQHAKVPPFASKLDEGIVQIHANEYLSPSQLQSGGVLVVGLGNSGAEIAMDVLPDHRTFVSGQPSAEIPFDHGTRVARVMLPVVRLVGRQVLSMRTPVGRKVRPVFTSKALPLIRTKLKHLEEAGVEIVARTTGVRGGRPLLEDGRTLDVQNVVWCTGFRYDFGWIDLPVFGEDGAPEHTRGVVAGAPGLYFVGLLFQFAAVSDVITGVGRDAAYVAKHIARRARSPRERAAA
jgi:putative flavoprotein involved in K+ transport